ncbi:MAG: hypothetical protein ACRD1N_05225 [Terriglobia bacterium]
MAIALTLTPRTWELLVMSTGGILGLEILAVVLRKGHLRPMLEAVAVTAGVLIICEYIKLKLQGARLERDADHAESKSG